MSSESTDAFVIKAENVTKRFQLHHGGTRTIKSMALGLFKGSAGRGFEALKDVSFSVGKGETLGIIGSNGAGKSTLLSLVAGTMATTEGSIETRGTISSLLELGAGFHPDLTGRENIFLYGAIMGLSREKMKERFDAIVEFAGIDDFIDQPVKHYSSGMYVRLGFAVAVEVDPDILLIDEVLAVGDAEFQRKCVMKMDEFREQGKTMLIISHDLPTIQSVSDRIVLLDEGKIVGIGDPEDVVETYESMNRKRGAKAMEREWGTGEVKLTNVEFYNEAGKETDKFAWGEPLVAKVAFEAEKRIEDPVFGFAVSNKDGLLIYGNNTQIEEFSVGSIEGKGAVELRIDSIAMATGTYLFSFSVHSSDHKTNYHRLDNSFPIAVESSKEFEGSCHMPCSWRMP